MISTKLEALKICGRGDDDQPNVVTLDDLSRITTLGTASGGGFQFPLWGKPEHNDRILFETLLIIDDYEQCTHSGEINVPWSEGVLSDDDIDGQIGEVVTGKIPGRTSEDGITVFDSTGLAIQDVAAAHVVYEHADERGNGTPFELISLDRHP